MTRISLALALLAAASANAGAITYEFTGTCTKDCSGAATAFLTLTNYTPGTVDTTKADFVSFSYTSSFVPSYTADNAELSSMSIDIPASLPGMAAVTLNLPEGEQFKTSTAGLWKLQAAADSGTGGEWALATPEPAVPTLMCLGLAAMLLKRRLN